MSSCSLTPPPSPSPGSRVAGGRLVSINKWEFASQIGTVTLNYESDGSPALLGEIQEISRIFRSNYFSGSARRSFHETQM